MRSVFRYMLPLLLLLGGCYDRHSSGGDRSTIPVTNTSLSKLRTLASGGCYEVHSDIICAGRITTTTKEGNFYRTLYLEDDGGAVEVLLGLYDADAIYPEGLYVALRLNGLAVMLDDGVVQVGLPPTSYEQRPRELESQQLIDQHLLRSNSVDLITPLQCAVGELSESMCGRLVALSRLRYAPLVEGEATQLVGMCRFEDSDAGVVYSDVSEYANFATESIPNGEVTICGILSYEYVGDASGECFVVKPRRLSDYFMVRNTSTNSCQNLSTVAISSRSSGE